MGDIEKLDNRRKQNKEKVIASSDRFLPVVSLNPKKPFTNAGAWTKSCNKKECKLKTIRLINDYDKIYREYTVATVSIGLTNDRSSDKVVLPLIIKNGHSAMLKSSDDQGFIEFRPSNSKVKLNPNRVKIDFKKHAALTMNLELTHTLKPGKKPTKFEINIIAIDDKDKAQDKKEVTAGKVSVYIHPDVVHEEDNKRIVSEANRVVELGIGAYCIQATDRYMGKGLKDKKNFLTVGSDNKKINTVSFGGLTGIDRGRALQRKGFTSESMYYRFPTKSSVMSRITNVGSTYQNNKYDAVGTPSNKNAILNRFKSGIRNKPGYHLYYVTIADGTHVLTFIVNNSNCCSPSYIAYDQNGLTDTARGKLDDIVDGIRKQISWVVAQVWMENQQKKLAGKIKKASYPVSDVYIWKMKKK